MKYCSKCGNPMEDDMLFCQECGTKFVVVKNTGPTIGQQQASNAFVNTISDNEQSTPGVKTIKTSKSTGRVRKGMKVWAIVCAVFAVLYVVIGAASGDTSMSVAMGTFCGILCGMFWVLAYSPKEKKGILGKDSGITKKKFVIICVIVAFVVCGISGGMSSSEEAPEDESQQTEEAVENTGAESTPEVEEETPDIALSTEFEKAVWEIAKANGGKLVSIESINLEEVVGTNVIASIVCANDETVVNSIVEAIATEAKSNDTEEAAIINFGDIEEGDNGELLVTAGVYDDGTFDISSASINYNSARNAWIKSQFSVWDGSHRELENMIIRNLNDEKSYNHIETNYRSIDDEADAAEINKILADAGYKNRVEIGDLFISTVFSAKNGFGGTIKSTAYGIASYNNNSITLIAIE